MPVTLPPPAAPGEPLSEGLEQVADYLGAELETIDEEFDDVETRILSESGVDPLHFAACRASARALDHRVTKRRADDRYDTNWRPAPEILSSRS